MSGQKSGIKRRKQDGRRYRIEKPPSRRQISVSNVRFVAFLLAISEANWIVVADGEAAEAMSEDKLSVAEPEPEKKVYEVCDIFFCFSSHFSIITIQRREDIVILEALSATGLRAIRYAKEIPLVKFAQPPFPSTKGASSSQHAFSQACHCK